MICNDHGKQGRIPFKISKGTLTGKRPLGRHGRRWKDNIRMYLKQIGINTRKWFDSTQYRNYWRTLVNTELKFWVP